MLRADERPSEILTHQILKGAKGRQIKPKTGGQKRYVDAIANNVITFVQQFMIMRSQGYTPDVFGNIKSSFKRGEKTEEK